MRYERRCADTINGVGVGNTSGIGADSISGRAVIV